MSKQHSAKAVAASCKAANASSRTAFRLKRSGWLLSAAVAAITLANPAHAQLAADALPTGGNVVGGSATIGTPTPTSMQVTQTSDRAVINWNSFDIGSGASVNFAQPSSTSIAVNRVTGGGAPSEIAGQLTANGRVAILNPNGVLFAGTADVDVGGLIASTGDIDQTAFMAGGNALDITGATGGEIIVNGNINISAGSLGLAAFVAPTVRNSGIITATAGRVQLGAGTAFTLDLAGDGLLSIGVPATSALVQNNGQIFAEGGRIQMSAKSASGAVDNLVNTGTLSVDSATLDNGTIVLEAVGGTANLSGTVAANDRNSVSRNILISSDQGVNISGNLSGASGTVNITAPHIWGAGKVSTATALKLNLSNDGTDTTGLGNYINDALGVIGTTGFGTTLTLGAGTYKSGVVVNANDVTIDGKGVAKIGWTSGIENAIDIWGDYVTVKNLEISGPATSGYTSFAWGSTNSRGIFVNRFADNVQLLNNNIHDIRTGIIVDGRNVNTYLLDNLIDNSKSGISIQYTDGSNITMTGNREGTIGNEWGINVYLNGIWDGVAGHNPAPSTSLVGGVSVGVLGTANLTEQARILAMSTANNGMSAQNIAYSAANRTRAYVVAVGGGTNTQGSQLSALGSIQAGVNAVVTGGTVYVADGNYSLGSSQLVINHALSLIGASQAGVVIDGRAASGNGLGTISVFADNVTLSNFTLLGSQLSGGNYGIKVQPNPAGHVNTPGGDTQRVSNFAISNVTVSGSRRAELDLNGVVGATITNFTANGLGTDGAGVQITDSANVTLSGVHTMNNNWGGVALYQSNSASAYNAQTTNITIDASQNNFEEANGLFTQDSSTTQDFGTLNLAGFNYAVRNIGSRSDANQFVWFQTSLGNATAFASGLGAAGSSIEGYTGTGFSNNFTVVAGMTIGAAVRDARTGANISVGAGTYVENVLVNKSGITLTSTDGRLATTIQGISGAGALGAVTVAANANNVTIGGTDHGFTILGIDNGNAGIENAALYLQGNHSNVTIQGNTITANGDHGLLGEYGAVNNGLLIDGNIFDGKTFVGAAPSSAPFSQQFTTANVSRQLVVLGGGAGGGNTSNVTFTNNQLKGNSGLNSAATIDAVGATITGNTFGTTTGGAGFMLRARGTNTLISGNVFDMAAVDYTAGGIYLRDAAMTTANFADLLAANTLVGAGAWADSSATDYHSFSRNIQGAVNEAAPGAVVTVRPGQYVEGVTGVDYYGSTGGQSFGLYLYKNDITLRGVDASGNAIADADDVVAFITSRYQAGFGAQHFVSGSGVTIEGLGFLPAATGDNKTVEVIGDAFTLRNSVIDNRGNETAANLYIDDFNDPSHARVETFTITGNKFYGGTYASAMVVVAAGAGRNTPASGRIFSNNLLSSTLAGMRGFQIQGYMPNTPWQLLPAGAVTVTNNVFDVDIPVRTVGVLSSAFAWDDVFRNNGNSFLQGAVLAYQGDSLDARGIVTAGGDLDIRITSSIADQLTRAQGGDTVRMLDGTYKLGSQLVINNGITLLGQSQAGTILDGRTLSGGNGLGTISVIADNVTLGNFSLLGSTSTTGNYGIKVQPDPVAYSASQRLNNFAIHDVTVSGSRRAELDLNGVIGATITNFTANGLNTDGAGVQITDSANVTLSGVHTLGNNWGGVALYQTNSASGYNSQTTNITIDAAQNNFEESNGLFSQLESTTQSFGTLNLTGFGYAVRNTAFRPDGAGFTFFRTDLADATGYATSLGAASSSIEGYTGTGFSNVFTVLDGFTIAAAMRDVRAGGTVNVGAGSFNEAVAITKSLTLAGAGIDATAITGGIAITSGFTGLTLRDFTVSGSANGSSVISNSGVLTNLTMTGVRIDGGNVANRHGFIGGQIGGDIAITNSEFVNIRGWAAFDTRSGASGNDGAQITSALFSNNLIDNTIGHIAFRQQIGAATLPDVTFSGNTVTNVGDATNSFGAIFKAFNANTVDFTGNNVSDIGTSGFNPAGEVAYGAALMTRGVNTLNVTGNSFSNNNQVFAVEPNRGLPTVTNFSNNVFTNNAYSIYLPGSVTGAGTINFGAGNNFVAGANTVQHIVWRSSADLDLTSVLFNGALASSLDTGGRFALTDLITDGIDKSGAGLARIVAGQVYVTDTSGAASLSRAAAITGTGDTVNVAAGTYSAGTVIATNGVSLLGLAGAKIDASHDGDNGITITGDGVTVSGFEIFGPANESYVSYAWPTITRGVVVANGADNATVTGNNIHDVRNGILIDGRNVNAALTGNVIDNTKSGISVQYTDGSNITISGNSEGAFGNEWGIITYLNGIWNGATITASAGALGPNTPLVEQQRLLALSAANGGMAVYNQGYSAANRTTAYVTPTGVGGAQGSLRTLLDLQGGFDAVVAGGTVHIAAGTYSEDATLDALRVLDIAGPITVNSLTFGSGAAGTNIGTSITATGALSFADGLVLTGDTVLSGDTVALGAITSGFGLTLNGANGVSIGLADLASLVANGSAILSAGVTTTGAQSFNGDATLKGIYAAGGDFTVTGLATLAGDTGVTSGGTASFGSLTGAQALTVSGANVDLGAATGLGSIAATGATIASAGASTSGAQTYTGATTLKGNYATGGGAFTVAGASTLGGATSVTTAGGTAGFGAVAGGGNALTVNAGTGGVTLGAASDLSSLTATGANIATVGVTSTGTQSYTGATALNGTYSASGFAVNGATTLGGSTSIATNGGNATLGAVDGTGGLTVNAGTGGVTLGAVSGLTSLSATGATIATSGAATSGAQAFNGATSLNGVYSTGGGAFTVNGAATTVNAVTVTTGGGNAGFGTVGGAGGLTVNAGTGGVTLGAVSGIASLSATGATIATNGAATTGAQSFIGATTLNGNYSASGFAVNGATTLGGTSSIATNGGNATLGSVGGTGGLTVNAGAGNVTLGAVSGLSSLSATGATIATSGATTTGAQSFTGATTLNGSYNASGFAVNGATTLGGTSSIATNGGNATFGTVGGTGGLTVNAGTGNITLGAVSGLASLSATGATLATAGATTSGAQSYTGATSLNGSYSASGFTVAGAATLGGATSVTTSGGNASFGTVAGGGNALTVDAGAGNISLGAASGLGALTATGANIATVGVTSTGTQSYTGATALNGTYSASGFAVNGATTLGGSTSIATNGGNATLGAVGGTGGLAVNAGTGNVTLGAVSGLTSLSATGATIATSGAATSGAQAFNGATSLNGAYSTGGGAFTVNGAATTVNAVTVTTGGGNAGFGTVGGAGGLTVNAGAGGVTLGAVSGIASLSATGATIATNGAATTGAQSFIGATTLNGNYSASGFAVNGATTLGGTSSIATNGGNATFGTVGGTGGLTVNAGTGNVSLGAVSGLSSLSATGATIATSGAATSGAQSYTGATTLNGSYTTGGGAFAVNGTGNLTGATSVTTGNGALTLGAVDAAVAGGQALTLNAGTGTATLGNMGALRRIGAVSVNAGSTVLNGATYAANSLSFTGGTGSTVRLTQGSTNFNTTLPGGAGGAITIQPDLIGTVNAQQNVSFTAGNGLTLNSGDVAIGNAGSEAIRLGTLSVLAHNFSAATVKLASTFTSLLSGSQVFSSNTLDTLGSVNAQVAGFESGPVRAGGSVTIVAGGSGSGSIIAGGPVSVGYGSDVTRTISSQGNVSVSSQGAIGGSVTSSGSVNLQTSTGAISSAVTATGPVNASSTSGNITAAITSNSGVTLGSTSGTIAGNVSAGGPVAISTSNGSVTSTVTTPGTASISSQSGAVNATVTGSGGVSVSTGGAVSGNYTSPTSITLTSTQPVNVQVNGSVVTVTAPSGTIGGVFSEIHTNDQGTFVVNEQPVVGSGTTDARQIIIDTFVLPSRGTVTATGEIQLPAGLALGLIAPAGNGQGGGRPAVVVNNVQRLGELLREGYTAIIIQLDETNLDLEEELAGN